MIQKGAKTAGKTRKSPADGATRLAPAGSPAELPVGAAETDDLAGADGVTAVEPEVVRKRGIVHAADQIGLRDTSKTKVSEEERWADLLQSTTWHKEAGALGAGTGGPAAARPRRRTEGKANFSAAEMTALCSIPPLRPVDAWGDRLEPVPVRLMPIPVTLAPPPAAVLEAEVIEPAPPPVAPEPVPLPVAGRGVRPKTLYDLWAEEEHNRRGRTPPDATPAPELTEMAAELETIPPLVELETGAVAEAVQDPAPQVTDGADGAGSSDTSDAVPAAPPTVSAPSQAPAPAPASGEDGQLEGVRRLLAERRDELQQVEGQLAGLRAELASLQQVRSETAVWQQRLDVARRKAGKLDERWHDLKDVEAELDRYHQEKAALRQDLDLMHAEVEALERQGRHLTEETAQVQAGLEHARQVLETLSEGISAAQRQLTEAVAANLDMMKLQRALSGTESALGEDVETTKRAVARFQTDLTALHQQLERQRTEMQAQLQRDRKGLDQVTRDIAAAQHLLKETVATLHGMEPVRQDREKAKPAPSSAAVSASASARPAPAKAGAAARPNPAAGRLEPPKPVPPAKEPSRRVPVEGVLAGVAGTVGQGVSSALAMIRGVGVGITQSAQTVFGGGEPATAAPSKKDMRDGGGRRDVRTARAKPSSRPTSLPLSPLSRGRTA